MPETLTAAEIAQLGSFDDWRAIRSADNADLVRSLAKRGCLDIGDWSDEQPRDPITGHFRAGRDRASQGPIVTSGRRGGLAGVLSGIGLKRAPGHL